VDLLAFAEFRVIGELDTTSTSLGDSFTVNEIKQRTKETSGRVENGKSVSWFLGVKDMTTPNGESVPESPGDVKIRFTFNDGNQGWHYAWQSHRMTRMTEHQLHIVILAADNSAPTNKEEKNYVCIAEESAAPFNMHCRRKRKRCPILSYISQIIAILTSN
jgi:hypothetical protein